MTVLGLDPHVNRDVSPPAGLMAGVGGIPPAGPLMVDGVGCSGGQGKLAGEAGAAALAVVDAGAGVGGPVDMVRAITLSRGMGTDLYLGGDL